MTRLNEGRTGDRGLSIVFLTYNRSDLLKIAVTSTRAALAGLAGLQQEFIVSDDASEDEHKASILDLGVDQVLIAEKNFGLSHNHNKALKACGYDYILSLQDDWEFVGSPETLRSAIEILDGDPEIGVINFIPPTLPIPRSERRSPSGASYTVFDNDGLPRKRGAGYRPYSDRPHLKRRQFVLDLGDYNEQLPMTLAELDFQQRVACQTRWKVAHLHGAPPFKHLGADRTFNPGYHRAQRLEQFYRLPVLGPVYRRLRTIARTYRGWLRERIRR
jgi:hypothetical protein